MSAPVSKGLCRACFGVVFAWNVLCAIQFLIAPADFAGAYQLDGVAGEAAVRGMGVTFLMWNATFPAFLADPDRFKALGVVALVQQIIGLMGEAIILFGLPVGYDALASSIARFIAFDAAGLLLMGISFYFFCKRASA